MFCWLALCWCSRTSVAHLIFWNVMSSRYPPITHHPTWIVCKSNSPTLISHHTALELQQHKGDPAAFIKLIQVQVKSLILECYCVKLQEPHHRNCSTLSMVAWSQHSKMHAIVWDFLLITLSAWSAWLKLNPPWVPLSSKTFLFTLSFTTSPWPYNHWVAGTYSLGMVFT